MRRKTTADCLKGRTHGRSLGTGLCLFEAVDIILNVMAAMLQAISCRVKEVSLGAGERRFSNLAALTSETSTTKS